MTIILAQHEGWRDFLDVSWSKDGILEIRYGSGFADVSPNKFATFIDDRRK